MDDRKLYRQKIEATIQQWSAKLDQLKARASGASADAKLKLNSQIQLIETKLKAGRNKASELTTATGDAWNSVRQGTDEAMEALKTAFGEAGSHFKD